MATFETTVLIARLIEDVFAFLSDLENVPKWNYGIVETRKISEGPIGVGTVDQQVRLVASRSEERLEIITYRIYAELLTVVPPGDNSSMPPVWHPGGPAARPRLTARGLRCRIATAMTAAGRSHHRLRCRPP